MKEKIIATIGILSLIVSIGITKTKLIDAREVVPGSNQDPVVTKSYVEKLIEESSLSRKVKAQEEIIDLLNIQINTIQSGIVGLEDGSPGNNIYQVVDVEAGDKLIGKQGTEIILRAGEGLAIRSELGGLQDVTEGTDIQEGKIPKYHLLITPRDDRRGVLVTKKATFMVRGDYRLE